MNTIYDGSFVLGQTSATNFQAGPGISITQPSEGTVRIANDETVLWSGNAGSSAFTISEPITNFERYKITDFRGDVFEFESYMTTPNFQNWDYWSNNRYLRIAGYSITNGITFTNLFGSEIGFASGGGCTLSYNFPTMQNSIKKVVGINRISGSNA